VICSYCILDCVPTPGGGLVVVDIRGGLGGDLVPLSAHGSRVETRARLLPYLERLGDVAQGRRILFIEDAFAAGQTFPDDFFNYVHRFGSYGPVTDWVPDLEQYRRRNRDNAVTPGVERVAALLDPLAAKARVKLSYCSGARVEYQQGVPKLLLSGYRQRARQRAQSVILAPEEVGVAIFGGPSERFPDDLRRQSWFPVLNPPVLDRVLESRWLVSTLLSGTPAEALLPRWIPVGMGLRTSEEVREFAATLGAPNGFPLGVLKPSHQGLSLALRFLDRTALRALSARQPERRIPARTALELLTPRIVHSYEEISGYRGKLLDNLLRTRGAEVHDHGDGTFHFSAPYPFLESTVAVLQEYVEARPIRSQRTGELHRGHLRVLLADDHLVAAVYRLDRDRDDGTFRDLTRAEAKVFHEYVPESEEATVRAQVVPFFAELRSQVEGRIRSDADIDRLRARWIEDQAAPS
jgi:hypothetical protein